MTEQNVSPEDLKAFQEWREETEKKGGRGKAKPSCQGSSTQGFFVKGCGNTEKCREY